LYASPNIIMVLTSRCMRWAGHVALMGELRIVHVTLVRKYQGKRISWGPRCRWEDHIRMDLRDVEWEIMDWRHLVQDRDQWQALVNTVVNHWVP